MEEPEYNAPVHDFMTPYLRRNRFDEASYAHTVVALWPGSPMSYEELVSDLYDRPFVPDETASLDESNAEVGFPAALNGVAVLEVRSEAGQTHLEDLEVFETPHLWTPHARYYLFKYAEPSALVAPERMMPGLRFLNESEWMPYPGTIVAGQLVHWEVSPDDFSPMPLPDEFLCDSVRASA